MVITNQPNPFYDIFIEPFHQGFDNIKAGFSGKRMDQLTQQAIDNATRPQEIEMSLLGRISAVVIGIILLIPLINTVAFAILRAVHSTLVFQRLSYMNSYSGGSINGPQVLGDPASPVRPGSGEDYLQRRNAGLALLPEMPVAQEPPATPQEYAQRKHEGTVHIPQYPANGHQNLVCSNDVLQYDLDAVLQRFNGNHAPSRLSELYDYAEYEDEKRWGLTNILNRYQGRQLNGREEQARLLLSKLFAFFDSSKALFPRGSDQEALFKAQIRDVYDRVSDAHNNCVDQVLGQLESIICDVIADFESIRGQGNQTMRDRIINRTAFTLFKYRANLIRQLCVTEYPDEHHMADMERLVKQRLAGMMGMQGGILEVGAQYGGMIHDVDEKIENIVHIFMFGEASQARMQRDIQGGVLDDRAAARRRESKYEPEQYLINALRTYHGDARTLRNDLLLWVRQHFNLEADDQLTTDFVRALSEEPDELNAADGGNLTHQALLYLLDKCRVLTNHVPFAAVAAPAAPVVPVVVPAVQLQVPIAV